MKYGIDNTIHIFFIILHLEMKSYFFDMIRHVRLTGEVILYKNILEINPDEIEATISYLEKDYKQEVLSYPYTSPIFSSQAAIWAACLFYYSSQLLLYREQNLDEVRRLVQPYNEAITPAAILSADLTLRFISDLLFELKLIDDTDPLIQILEDILHVWHYSAIGYGLENIDSLDFLVIKEDKCLNQLYIDRVIKRDALLLSHHPSLYKDIESELSIYKKNLWGKFE